MWFSFPSLPYCSSVLGHEPNHNLTCPQMDAYFNLHSMYIHADIYGNTLHRLIMGTGILYCHHIVFTWKHMIGHLYHSPRKENIHKWTESDHIYVHTGQEHMSECSYWRYNLNPQVTAFPTLSHWGFEDQCYISLDLIHSYKSCEFGLIPRSQWNLVYNTPASIQ